MIKLDLDPGRKQLRVFGAVGSLVFGAIALWLWLGAKHEDFPISRETTGAVSVVCGLLAAYSLVSAIAAPKLLRPLYVVLSLLAFPIGFVASFLVLGVIFYGVVFPIAMIFRAFGRDTLTRRMDRDAPSYWVKRSTQKDVKRYFRQF